MTPFHHRIGSIALSALAATILAFMPPNDASSQNVKEPLPHIGYLNSTAVFGVNGHAFVQALSALGYIDGRDVTIDYRFAKTGKQKELVALAKELVRQKVQVIVALSPPAARAAMRATRTIPIVVRSSTDPVEGGWVKSMKNPGGNVTGLTSLSSTLLAKRIELLKELIPGMTRVGIMLNPGSSHASSNTASVEEVSRQLHMSVQTLPVRTGSEFEAAFGNAMKGGVQGIVTIRNPLIVRNRTRIAKLAASYRLPMVFDERAFAKAGGLMSYGANNADLSRRAAAYVVKILKGAKAGDLPIGEPTKFELVVNLKTAKAMGVTVPRSILGRADQIIQ